MSVKLFFLLTEDTLGHLVFRWGTLILSPVNVVMYWNRTPTCRRYNSRSSTLFIASSYGTTQSPAWVRRLFYEVDEGSVPINREHFISHSMMMSWTYTMNIALWTTKTAIIWLYIHGICVPGKYMRRNTYLEKYSFTIPISVDILDSRTRLREIIPANNCTMQG